MKRHLSHTTPSDICFVSQQTGAEHVPPRRMERASIAHVPSWESSGCWGGEDTAITIASFIASEASNPAGGGRDWTG